MQYKSSASKKLQDLPVTKDNKTHQPCFIAVDIVMNFLLFILNPIFKCS